MDNCQQTLTILIIDIKNVSYFFAKLYSFYKTDWVYFRKFVNS